jgi:hypothetical protein
MVFIGGFDVDDAWVQCTLDTLKPEVKGAVDRALSLVHGSFFTSAAEELNAILTREECDALQQFHGSDEWTWRAVLAVLLKWSEMEDIYQYLLGSR